MRHRSALFVGGFPLALIAIGYSVVISVTRQLQNTAVKLTNHQAFTYFGGLFIILIGGIYGVYWYISTANELKLKHKGQLPNYIYLIIPFLNWWWLWRYTKLATKIIGIKYRLPICFYFYCYSGLPVWGYCNIITTFALIN